MSILTSSSQYLQPEYLSPSAPNQMDTKSSPLALLTATCNSIGKDSPNSKSTLQPLDAEKKRKDDGEANCGRNSSASSIGSFRSLSPDKQKQGKANYGSPKKDLGSLKEIRRSPAHITSDVMLKIGKDYSRSRSVSPKDKRTESGRISDNPHERVSAANGLPLSSTAAPALSLSSNTSGYDTDKKASTLPLNTLPSYPMHLPLAGLNPLSGYPLSHLGGSGAAALLAAHKHSAEAMKYTTVRTATGATTLVPVCSDPYCAHCKLTLQAAQLSPAQCTSGCVQCTHDKGVGLPPNYPHAAALSAGLLGLPGLGALPGISPASSALFSAAAAPGNNSTQPYVCSWISNSGSGVCGKRFTSSEELMQHLRSHTSSLENPSVHSGIPYPTLPTSLSSTLLRQTYSGRLSPALLSASRFHPYLKSLSSLHPSDGGLPPVPPSLGAYSSLYSLYGHKLGVP